MKRLMVVGAASALVAGIAGCGGSSKSNDAGVDPGRMVTVTASVGAENEGATSTQPSSRPSVVTILKKTTFYEYLKQHSNSEMQPLQEAIVDDVNIPFNEWDLLPLKERATRAANYIEFETVACNGAGLIGENEADGKTRLDEVNWSPYVTRDQMSLAGKGDKAVLKKLETIRRMYECSIGSSQDNRGNYTPQIKENLMHSFFSRPHEDTVNREDYYTDDGHSMLNTDDIIKYGGTINVFPKFKPMAFDGITINAPDPAWRRGPEVDPPEFEIMPVQTSTGKYIPMFGYTSSSSPSD